MKDYYYNLLNDVDFTTNPENFQLDKCYDKNWFLNDLDKIFNRFEETGSENYLNHQLGLWRAFLQGCIDGKYK
jgi:hypothetical protein